MLTTAASRPYFSRRIDVSAVCTQFKDAAAQDKQAEVERVMGWWDSLVDCFTGYHQRDALSLLFDIAQAEKDNEVPGMTASQKLANRETAKEAFFKLEKCALPCFKFEIVPNANREMCFKITDSRTDESVKIPVKFNYFDTEKAETIWLKMRSSFVADKPAAVELLNQMINSTTSCETMACFTQLTQLAEPEDREHFKLQVTDEFTGTSTISAGFKGTLLFDSLACPRVQMEEIIKSLLTCQGAVSQEKGNFSSPETADRLTMILRLRGGYFKRDEPTKVAAAKILKDMYRNGRGIQDDLSSFSRLMKLDPEIRNLVEFRFSKNEAGQTVIGLTFDGKPCNQGVIENSADLDLSNLDLRGVDLHGVNFDNANLTGADFTGANLTDVRMTGAKVHGTTFDLHALRGGLFSDAQLRTLKLDEVGTKMQALWRARFATTRKQSPEAMTRFLKNSKGEVVAYWKDGKWVAPPKFRLGESGGNKRITGRSNGMVKLEIMNPEGFASVNTFDQRALDFINDNHLDKLKPQIRINATELLATDLGEKDLVAMLNDGKKFRPASFKSLARQLQFLHRNGYVHRDIKPENIFFESGEMCLTDLDSMGRSGEFRYRGFAGTPQYVHPKLIGNPHQTDYNDMQTAMKLDQYALINTMIIARMWEIPVRGVFPAQIIAHFAQTLKCDRAHRENLIAFLLDPVANDLLYDLDTYM